jgi:hypothetical protein
MASEAAIEQVTEAVALHEQPVTPWTTVDAVTAPLHNDVVESATAVHDVVSRSVIDELYAASSIDVVVAGPTLDLVVAS